MTDDVKMPELLNCPFCGSGTYNVINICDPYGKPYIRVECDGCGSSTRNWCATQEEAVKAWNTRADLAASSGDDVQGALDALGDLVVFSRKHATNFGMTEPREVIYKKISNCEKTIRQALQNPICNKNTENVSHEMSNENNAADMIKLECLRLFDFYREKLPREDFVTDHRHITTEAFNKGRNYGIRWATNKIIDHLKAKGVL